jgi:hypothetical protein
MDDPGKPSRDDHDVRRGPLLRDVLLPPLLPPFKDITPFFATEHYARFRHS